MPATWPDRFVYVCSATQGAAINHIPLHHAGAERLAGMVILCALTSPNRPTQQDRSNALVPAERLIRTACEVLGLNRKQIQMFTGHADLLAPWTGALHLATEMAAGANASVVFNVTSGRKTATLGALLGAPRTANQPEIVMISVGLDGTIRRIDIMPDGTLHESPLPAKTDQTLQGYLGYYGLRLIDPRGRDRREADLLGRTASYAAIASGLPYASFSDGLARLQSRLAKSEDPLPISINIPVKDVEVLGPLLATINGVVLEKHRLTVQTEAARRFLSGVWLEGMALRALQDALRTIPGLHIAQGVEVASHKAAKVGLAETDFDLALLSGERLGLIECKAGRSTRLVRHGVVHLAQYRSHLTAQAGGGWLLAPLANDLRENGVVAQAAERGITVLNGPSAIEDLVRSVSDWVQAR